MPTISQLLQYILSKRYGEEVRGAIHDAIEKCYQDVNRATLREDAFQAALQAAIDRGDIPGMVIADNSVPGTKIQDGTLPLSKLAEPVQITVDSALSATSTNPVQNKVIKGAIDELNGSLDDITETYIPDDQSEEYIYSPLWSALQSREVTERGITVISYANGTVKVSGTATANASIPIYVATTNTVTLTAGKTYRLRGCPSGGGSTSFGLDIRTTLGGTIYKAEYGTGIIFTQSETASYYLHLRVASGKTVNFTFIPIIEERTLAPATRKTAKDIIARKNTNCISYTESQNLTDAQQAMAIENIGLGNRVRRDMSRVFNNAQLLHTTTPNAEVDRYSDGSGEWEKVTFKTVSGWTTQGIERNDGSIVYPMPNNEPIPVSNAPMPDIIDVAKSYIKHSSNLVYGNYYTMYDETCTNEIDCSTFVCAILNGIRYENSRYYLGTGNANILGEYLGYTLMYKNNTVGWRRLLTDQMAQWFARHNRLFKVPQSADLACSIIQPGDILFSGVVLSDASEVIKSKYYNIVHCSIVLYTHQRDGVIVVAEAGNSQESVTVKNNENGVCKTKVIRIDEISSTNGIYQVFARPNYGQSVLGRKNEIIYKNGACVLNPYLKLNCGINNAGLLSYDGTHASTPHLYDVSYGERIQNVSDSSYSVVVYEYDENQLLVNSSDITSNPITVGSSTKYVRFSITKNNAISLLDVDKLRISVTEH